MSQSTSPPISKKRSHDGELINQHASPRSAVNLEYCTAGDSINRAASPAISTTGSSLTELTSISVAPIGAQEPTVQESKKRKLTFAEREVQKAIKKQQKEEQERQKAEEKSQKEDARRLRDEEKKIKNEEKEVLRKAKEHEREVARQVKESEREEKKKAKDAEKQEKEAEKAKKDAEMLKKQKSQLKIGSFFGRPAVASGAISTSPSTIDEDSVSVVSRRSSVSSIDAKEQVFQPKVETAGESDYHKWILPFFPHDHTDVAPINRFQSHHESSAFGGKGSDAFLGDLVEQSVSTNIRERFCKPRKKMRPTTRVKDIVTRMNELTDSTIDLTGDDLTEEVSSNLVNIPYKSLSFCQDVRPPYQGTFTRAISSYAARKLSRLPTWRGIPDINYDYDSEAEWQEPEEGDDDLGDEDEMSEDEDGEEDMEDFLDDEADIGRRRIVAGEMEPVSSGLQWEGVTANSSGGFDFSKYRICALHDSTNFPIDPYSTEHWVEADKKSPQKAQLQVPFQKLPVMMQPPRLPLSTVDTPNVPSSSPFSLVSNHDHKQKQDENGLLMPKQRGRAPNPNKPLKMISDEILPAFRDAINGSDLNKVALTEILKKKFPKCSKDAIKDTLSTIAVRQGVKEVEKRWVIIS